MLESEELLPDGKPAEKVSSSAAQCCFSNGDASCNSNGFKLSNKAYARAYGDDYPEKAPLKV